MPPDSAAATRPPRRTQEERSAATQARVLDAAVACLVELGYAGTTTTVVAERAGVSRGAQLHHYATRAELIGAAVQHVFTGLTDDYRSGFARIASRPDRLRGAVELLWDMYLQPRHLAALDLYLAARTHPELRAALAPVAARHRENVLALAREYFPEAARDEARFTRLLDLILNAMLGMALSRGLYGERPAAEGPLLAEIERLAQQLFTRVRTGDRVGRGGGHAPARSRHGARRQPAKGT